MANKKGGKQVFNAKREPLFRCGFPNCGAIFAKEPGKPDACIKHRNLIEDVVFIMNHLGEPPPAEGPATDQGPKLYIPKPGMGDQAIKEARQAQRGKP